MHPTNNAASLPIMSPRRRRIHGYLKTYLINYISQGYVLIAMLFASCAGEQSKPAAKLSPSIEGTWQLISGTLVEKGDTTVTDYTKNVSMIKVLNKTHFAFLNHDMHHGKDSTASFSAGGGTYTLTGDQYTENLEYCSAREWEGHEFPFTIEVHDDTLIQRGIEKLEDIGVERLNIERYVRVKN